MRNAELRLELNLGMGIPYIPYEVRRTQNGKAWIFHSLARKIPRPRLRWVLVIFFYMDDLTTTHGRTTPRYMYLPSG